MNDSPLSPEAVAQMVADVKQEITVECVNSEMDRLVAGRIMKALTTLAAENATLRADAAKALQWAKEQHACADEYAAEVVALRASEAAAPTITAELIAAHKRIASLEDALVGIKRAGRSRMLSYGDEHSYYYHTAHAALEAAQ